MQLPRLTELEYHTFNTLVLYWSENRGQLPSINQLRAALRSESTKHAIYKRMLNLTKKGYLKINEQGKYEPTGEGLSQITKDITTPERRLKRYKNATRHRAYQTEVTTQQQPTNS